MNKRDNRLEQFMKFLNEKKFLSVHEMAQLLNVSDMTVRRDAEILKDRNLIVVTNGILMLDNDNTTSFIHPIRKAYVLSKEAQVQNSAKNAIGRFAASLIQPDDCVILDTGSTTDHITPHIASDLHISLLCYNLNILMQAQQNPNIKISFAGGHYHPNTQMFESPDGIDFIHSIRANKAFISAAGIHKNLGITCSNTYEVLNKQAVLRSASEHILVADSSKFGKVHVAYFCELENIDVIITDKGLSEEWISIIEEKNIKLYLV